MSPGLAVFFAAMKEQKYSEQLWREGIGDWDRLFLRWVDDLLIIADGGSEFWKEWCRRDLYSGSCHLEDTDASVFAGISIEVNADQTIKCSASLPNWESLFLNNGVDSFRLAHANGFEGVTKLISRVASLVIRVIDLASVSWSIEDVHKHIISQLKEFSVFGVSNDILIRALRRLDEKYKYLELSRIINDLRVNGLEELFESTGTILIERENSWIRTYKTIERLGV